MMVQRTTASKYVTPPQKKDSRVRVIHKENGGVVSARKAGLSVAVGKYAGYVDGDDWIDEHMYEHMINAMEKI